MKPSEQIDRHIAGIADWRGSVLAMIRRTMLEADPAVTEDWKWMGTPVWYCDGMVCLANPHAGKVKWTFVKGADFADADGLFNAGLGGNEWRAIDIFEKDRLNEAALRRLVRTAITYNRSQRKGDGARPREEGAPPPSSEEALARRAPPDATWCAPRRRARLSGRGVRGTRPAGEDRSLALKMTGSGCSG